MKDSFGLSSIFPLLQSVREGYKKALENLRAGLESRHLTRVAGRPTGFGSNSFSMDGRLFLYVIQNGSTQSGSRPPADLPKVVVYDVSTGSSIGVYHDLPLPDSNIKRTLRLFRAGGVIIPDRQVAVVSLASRWANVPTVRYPGTQWTALLIEGSR